MDAIIEEVDLEELVLKIRQDSQYDIKIKSGWRIAGLVLAGLLAIAFLVVVFVSVYLFFTATDNTSRIWALVILVIPLFDAVLIFIAIWGSFPYTTTIESNGNIYEDHIFLDSKENFMSFSHIELSVYKSMSRISRYRTANLPGFKTYEYGRWVTYIYSIHLIGEGQKRFTIYRDTSKDDILRLTHILSFVLQIPVVELHPDKYNPYSKYLEELDLTYSEQTPVLNFTPINPPKIPLDSSIQGKVSPVPRRNLPKVELFKNTPVRPMTTRLMYRKTITTYISNLIKIWLPFLSVISFIAIMDALFFKGKLYGLEFGSGSRNLLYPFVGLFVNVISVTTDILQGVQFGIIHIFIFGPLYSLALIITWLLLKDMSFGKTRSFSEYLGVILRKLARLYPILVFHQALVQIGWLFLPVVGAVVSIVANIFVVFSYAVALEEPDVPVFAIPKRLIQLNVNDKSKTFQIQLLIGMTQFILSSIVYILLSFLFASNATLLYVIAAIITSIFAPLSGVYPFYLYFDRYYRENIRLKIADQETQFVRLGSGIGISL
ncbi:MAG: hypothetical protein ACTSPV_13585 [Candidatus Hodarchaeales archaeon]